MQTNNYLRKTLALVMAFLMIVTMLPMNVFAEVAPANWNDDNPEARYWPIPHQGRLVKVSKAEPLKNPSLRYIGGYTRPDGREVVRLAFGGYLNATSGVWNRLVLKPDHNLNELIDWDQSGMGKKMPGQFPNNHDGWSFNNEFIKFESMSAQQGGSGNLHVVKLGLDGTQTTNAPLQYVNFETPIDLVLKEGQTVKTLTTNPLIQMRLMDVKYEQIYSTTIDTNQEVPYSSYTMSTFIPVRVNLKQGILNTDVARNHENLFQSASSYIKYNEEKGYIDVYTRRTQGAVGSKADSGGAFNAADERNEGNYGFMQTFDESFIDILKSQDESKTVAQIFTADTNDNIINAGTDPTVAKPGNRIDFPLEQIERKNGVGILKVTNNRPNDTFMTTGANGDSYGTSTVVRYFIDKSKLIKKFGSSDIVSYEFFSTVFATNPTGVEEFKSVPRNEDIDLKRGDTIDIRFDGRRDLVSQGTFDTRGSFIQIGDDQYKISIRTTADKTSYTGRPSEAYMRKMTVKVPFDIKIKKDTPLTIFSRKTRNMEVSPGMTVTFNYSAKDISGRTIKKDKTYRFERPLVAGYTRNAAGEIFKDSKKINKPTQALFIDNHEPLMTSRQENFGGGILTKTVDVPDVDETFTDTTFLSGRSKYDRVNVYVYKGKNQETNKAEDRIATIKASDQKVKMNVNGDDVEGFQWASNEKFDATVGADNSAYVDPKVWAKKDTGIYFTNQDVLQNALENDFPVVEQIQAKVGFDLNGGKLPKNVVSYQGIDASKLPGTEFAYDLSRQSESEKITRIAPLNTKIRGQEGYTESGFAGDNVNYKDHNGNDLEGDALELRKMPADKPDSADPDLEFLGWTTQRMSGDATNDFIKLKVATTVDEVKSGKNYIFTDKTPFDSKLTVYAAYGKPLVKLILHRNMNENDAVTEEIILKDTDFVRDKVLDIPKMYYNTSSLKDNDFIEKFNADNFQEDFLKENTFVGWMLPNQANNGYKEERTYQAGALLENNGYTPEEINKKAVKLSSLSPTKALPNTFGLDIDKSFEEFVRENGRELHLYASYRPFYTVNVKKQFKKDTEDGYKDLTTEEDLKKIHDVKFGLLYRTAVTNWNDPTVLQAANYYTLNPANLKDTEILKEWKKDEQNTLTWSVPGYDILGQRISYIGVEVPIGEEKTYAEHKGADDWSTLGINVYMRIPEGGGNAIQDKNAPFDPINPLVRLSKSQSVSIKRTGSTDVDAFTAATSRKPLGVDTAVQGKKDSKLGPTEIAQITGYEITVTNIPVDVETPKFKGNIYEGEKTITIYRPKDDAINKLKVTFKREGWPTYEQVFTKKPNEVDAWTSATPGGNPAFDIVKDSDGDYVIQLENKTYKFKKDDVITAQFLKGDAPSKTATNTVQPKLDANKITDIKQVPFERDGSTDIVKVRIQIPNPTPGAPGAGSVFTPGTIDESGNFTPLPGVDPIVTGENLKAGEFATLQIPRDKVNHGDKIYFESDEGRSKHVMTPGANADRDGFGHVELDLEGPVIKDPVLKDDHFRMFASLTASLSELAEDNVVKIIFGNREETFKTKTEAIDYFRAMGREVNAKDMPEVKIIAYDKFNNKSEATVKYEREETIDIWLNYFEIDDEELNVKATAGATIDIKIRNGGKVVASATVDSATGDFEDVTLTTEGSSEPYKLKRGDIIFIGATNASGARANQLVRFVR